MFNLLAAVLWLIFAAVLLISQQLGDSLQGRHYYLAALAVLMSGWNLVRWTLMWRAIRRRRASRRAAGAALSRPTRGADSVDQRDGTFDFSNGEPPPIRRADAPPPGT